MDDALIARMTEWRRHLHAYPEMGFQETQTAAFVCARLAELGIPFQPGVAGTGVVATLARGTSNRSVGLRADMDALPITETSGVPYASTRPGVMHACGHDGHTAGLLGAAALLAADRSWSGTVQLVFQPAEEGAGGAKAMLDDGLLERFPMERIFGLHNWPGLEAGTVMVHPAAVMAGVAWLDIDLQGVAGHAAQPHLTRDPMLAAAHLMVALQSIVARSIDPQDPAVVSICRIEGGTAYNQIPRAARLSGTVRYARAPVQDAIEAAIRRIADGTATSFGVTAKVDYRVGGPSTVNASAEAALAVAAAEAAGLAVRQDLPASMAGEDFAWFLQQRPGAFVWIGNGPVATDGELHNSGYDFNDAILPAAAAYLAAVAKHALSVSA